MRIFLYDTWDSDEVRSFLGISEQERAMGTLDDYEVKCTSEGYPSIVAQAGSSVLGSLSELEEPVFEVFKEWVEDNTYCLIPVSIGIEQVLTLIADEAAIDDNAVPLSGYELRGILQREYCADHESDEGEEANEVDLFTKYTFRDKEWWNKYKIAMVSISGAAVIALIIFCGILVQWLWSSKYTDNLGEKVRGEVTASTPAYSTPTEVIGFNGEPIQIIFPEDIQPTDESFDIVEIDFDELRQKYPHAVAWLVVPGVGIEYPIAQSEDNEYYLTHSIQGTYSRAGWVFADYRNTMETPMRNFLIYGHNMKDGTIFGKLPRVLDESWWSNPDNQYIYLVTEYYTAVYQVFTTLRVKSEEVYYYRRDLGDRNIVSFMEEMKSYDLIPDKLTYNKPFKSSDKLITLSTCADAQGVEKFVVQGVLVYSKQLKDSNTMVSLNNPSVPTSE